MLGIQEIMKALPHRYPFLLCDKILEIDYGNSVKGIKNVSINEPFFQGHFPDEPIMPGVLILETMAQIGGFIFYNQESEKESLKGKIVKMNDVKFLREVVPGDVMEVTGEIVERSGSYAQAKLVAKVNNKTAAKAVITYYFK
jgi:beta-hydroxyacyl-ACP dehydratase FabZ